MADVMNGTKHEYGTFIKDEGSDAGTPMSVMSEDVEEEDTGELTMPRDSQDESAYPGLILTRVPKDLYSGISTTELRLDEPIRIGTVKVWTERNPTTGKPKMTTERDSKTGKVVAKPVPPHMRVILNRDLPGFEMVAKDYDFDVINQEPINTFVFTEKDLPGYKAGAFSYRSSQRNDRIQKSYGGQNGGRSFNRQRRSIPKKTALVGYSKQEASLHPIENEEYARVERAKERAAARADALSSTLAFQAISADADRPGADTWSGFTRSAPLVRPVNRQLNKAERLPQNELIDKLVALFQEFTYWGFKTMVRRVNQPEAYVKETLSKIAVLVKSGPFANNYMMSQQYRELNNIQESLDQGTAAPQLQGDDIESDADGAMKDEDDDGEMEDVA